MDLPSGNLAGTDHLHLKGMAGRAWGLVSDNLRRKSAMVCPPRVLVDIRLARPRRRLDNHNNQANPLRIKFGGFRDLGCSFMSVSSSSCGYQGIIYFLGLGLLIWIVTVYFGLLNHSEIVLFYASVLYLLVLWTCRPV
jgi:hypothetical protein